MKVNNIKIVKELLLKVTPINDYNVALKLLAQKDRKIVVSFVNLYALQISLLNSDFLECIKKSDVVFIDGIALKIISRLLKIPTGMNMNGTDFIPFFINKNKSGTFSFYGAEQKVQNSISRKYAFLNIKSGLNGFLEDEVYIKDSDINNPQIIILGMGMPKQELLSFKINSHSIIINGGAILDYISGEKKRAPLFFVRLKLEWLHRSFSDPKQYLKRYYEGFLLFYKIVSKILLLNFKVMFNFKTKI